KPSFHDGIDGGHPAGALTLSSRNGLGARGAGRDSSGSDNHQDCRREQWCTVHLVRASESCSVLEGLAEYQKGSGRRLDDKIGRMFVDVQSMIMLSCGRAGD